MGTPTGETLTDDDLRRAAALRFCADSGVLSWGIVCERIKCDVSTLRAARRSDRWKVIVKEFELDLEELRQEAFAQLSRFVAAGSQWAVLEALNRTEGKVADKLDVTFDGNDPRELLNSRLAGIAAREDAGGGDSESE